MFLKKGLTFYVLKTACPIRVSEHEFHFSIKKKTILVGKLTGKGQIFSNLVSFVLSLGLGFVEIVEWACSCCDLLELAPLGSFEVPHS